MEVPVLGFAAYSGTGKTTLIERLLGRLTHGKPICAAQLLRILEHYYAVAHYDAHKRDQTQNRGDAEIQTENPQTEESSEEAEGTQQHSQHRKRDFFEMEDQEDEEHQHGCEK